MFTELAQLQRCLSFVTASLIPVADVIVIVQDIINEFSHLQHRNYYVIHVLQTKQSTNIITLVYFTFTSKPKHHINLLYKL